MRRTFVLCSMLAGLWSCGACLAEPVVPSDDAQVIETLPAGADTRAAERRLRRELARQPRDAGLAVALAKRHLDLAHEQGDPRPAGQALAVLQRWSDPARTPDEVLLMQATVQQYLHRFDAAIANLEALTRRQPRQAQAWLSLATLHRVQGRYGESDTACRGVAGAGAALHAEACLAENQALRGDFDAARARLTRLAAGPRVDAATRNWVLTSLAELELRAGRPAAADSAFRAALRARADAYTTLSYADFLLLQGREAQALAELEGQPRSDGVLLRRAIAGLRLGSAQAAADVRELRERIALANERPGAELFHAREQAMFALWVEQRAPRALELARLNLRQQREPLDLLVFAQAAIAAGDAAARREAEGERAAIGLRDERLNILR